MSNRNEVHSRDEEELRQVREGEELETGATATACVFQLTTVLGPLEVMSHGAAVYGTFLVIQEKSQRFYSSTPSGAPPLPT